MKYVLAIDPGKSSGIALLSYSDTQPAKLVAAWQFSGGIQGLLDWTEINWSSRLFGFFYLGNSEIPIEDITVVAEKFVPIPGRGFTQGLDSTLPLVGEGVLIALGYMPVYSPEEKRWQRPQAMYKHGGKSLAEKKKLSRAFLKKHEMYVTGKQLEAPDSDDAMSAILHALSYITHTIKHQPTWEAYYG